MKLLQNEVSLVNWMDRVGLQFLQALILSLYGAVANLDGTRVIKSEIKGRKEDAVLLGQELGKEIMIKSNGETIYK